jgi:DNA-binding transcriptional ArsR family regulator
LTIAIDITDPTLARAYAHPLRIQILGLLDNRTASPREIAAELGTPLSNTAYHVRQLVTLGLVELVSRTARRGAIEHHYTARVRPTITDQGWAELPGIIKRAIVGGLLQQSISHVLIAAEEGGFDREDAHHSRTAGPLDAKGWKAVARELANSLKRIEQAFEESRVRLAEDPEAEGVEATVVLMQCEGPKEKSVAQRRSGEQAPSHRDASDDLELDDLLPPGA